MSVFVSTKAETANQANRVGPPWVLVCAGFHQQGGQAKANAALADYLVRIGRPVHLVGHDFDSCFLDRPGVTPHVVRRPYNRDVLGWRPLERRARRLATAVTDADPTARVLVNGGCCAWPHINWVHCVHHAWHPADRGAPLWFRAKNRLFKWWARRRERLALRPARLVVANSAQTREHLIYSLGIEPDRVHVVHLGADPAWTPPSDEERHRQRTLMDVPAGRPVVMFAGALGHDHNKGFDTLLAAWRTLAARGDWDALLLVAGAGNGLPYWRRRVAHEGLGESIRFLGFTNRLIESFAAVDLLVSPARYEAYGMNVQEAVSLGVPALVSCRAGVVERYTPELAGMVLPDPEDAADLAHRLLQWRADIPGWRERFRPLSEAFRAYTWDAMSARIVALAEEQRQPDAAFRAESCAV